MTETTESTAPEQVQSFEEFWRFYLGEHRDPRSRRLHFVGTTGFLLSCGVSTALNPIAFPATVLGSGLIGVDAARTEKAKRPWKHVMSMLALPSLAAPTTFPAGVAFAYGCAWIGHLRYERNKPATFRYPVMSLASDLRMWTHMLKGRLWKGDPLQELGFEPPRAEPEAPSAEPAADVAAE